jgi:serine/threonine protein kinase
MKEHLLQKYDKLKMLENDNMGNAMWLVQGKYDRKQAFMKEINMASLLQNQLREAEGELKHFQSMDKHPNVQLIREWFKEPESSDICLVYEYCDSEDLASELRRRKDCE